MKQKNSWKEKLKMAKVKVEFSEFKSYLISMLGMMYVLGAQGHKFVSLLDRLCAMENNNPTLIQNVLTLLKKKLDAGVDIKIGRASCRERV